MPSLLLLLSETKIHFQVLLVVFFFFFFFTLEFLRWNFLSAFPLVDLDAPAGGLGFLRDAQQEHAVREGGLDLLHVGVRGQLHTPALKAPRALHAAPLDGQFLLVPRLLVVVEPHFLLGGLFHAQLEDPVVAHFQLHGLPLHAREVGRDLVAVRVLRHVERQPAPRAAERRRAPPALTRGGRCRRRRAGRQPAERMPPPEELGEGRLQRVRPALEHHQRHFPPLSFSLSRSRCRRRRAGRQR